MSDRPEAPIDARREAWSGYWARGALHSCAGSYAGNYGGAIGAFWDDVAGRLPPGARVLDLATGNGALPLRLSTLHADTAPLRVDAVDLAEVAPPWHDPATHPRIAFHPGVSIDALPFPDATFDLVASQYGIEYAPMPASLDEALRVLRPGGTLALAMHHAGSVLVRVGREELAHLRRLLATGGLLDAARGALPWIERARAGEVLAGQGAAADARARYNAAAAEVGDAIAASFAPDLLVEVRQQVHRLLAGAPPGGADAGSALEELAAALRDAGLRTSEMVSHALDADAALAMADRVRAVCPGASVTLDPVAQAEGVLAWALVARPGAQ